MGAGSRDAGCVGASWMVAESGGCCAAALEIVAAANVTAAMPPTGCSRGAKGGEAVPPRTRV